MTNEHPITPPPELVQQWWEEADQDCDRDDPKNYFDYIATQAARWGADQELWTPNYLPPKPPMTDPIRSLCAQPEPTVDDILLLAAIIREVDGGNRLGAAQLAEDILSHPASRWGRPTPQPPADGEVAELVAWLTMLRDRPKSEACVAATFDHKLTRAAELVQRQHPQPVAIPGEEYHEHMGPVTWWRLPVEEPPWVGTPNDSDWPGYHTHFTPPPPEPLNAHAMPMPISEGAGE